MNTNFEFPPWLVFAYDLLFLLALGSTFVFLFAAADWASDLARLAVNVCIGGSVVVGGIGVFKLESDRAREMRADDE